MPSFKRADERVRDEAYDRSAAAGEGNPDASGPIVYGLGLSESNDDFMRDRGRWKRYRIVIYVLVALAISHFVVGFPSLYHLRYLWHAFTSLFTG